MPGFSELIVILVILVIVFGAQLLPMLGDAIDRMTANSKRSAANRSEEKPKA
jgi:Sec-independent protein translocase protein TatA